MVGRGHQQRQALKVAWNRAQGETAAAELPCLIEEIWRWHKAQVVWCALVYVSESRLKATVVGQFGEPLPLQHREQFALLSHLLWFVKKRTQENAVVMWLRKPMVEHLFEWRMRIRVWLIGGRGDLLMVVTWDGRFHSVWVTGTPLFMVWVRQLLFGDAAMVVEVARV